MSPGSQELLGGHQSLRSQKRNLSASDQKIERAPLIILVMFSERNTPWVGQGGLPKWPFSVPQIVLLTLFMPGFMPAFVPGSMPDLAPVSHPEPIEPNGQSEWPSRASTYPGSIVAADGAGHRRIRPGAGGSAAGQRPVQVHQN